MKRIHQSLITRYRREVAVSCAVLASLLMVGKLSPLGTHDVVVAVRDVPVGATLTAEDLGTVKSRSWPNEVRNMHEVIGKTINHSVPSGGLITKSDLVSTEAGIQGHVQIAVPITTSDAQLISSGAHVDIYSPLALIAANAIVVSVVKDSKSGILSSRAGATAVLAVAESDVAGIAAAKDGSALTIALR
jgi:Flp pilus assembly protein CpaB